MATCIICILDTLDDPNLFFDEKGVCNYCTNYKKKYIDEFPSIEFRSKQLEGLLEKIKQNGVGKKYDSIMGLSGGVDSSYLAYLAKEWGLNPLLIHFYNGWNSNIAV